MVSWLVRGWSFLLWLACRPDQLLKTSKYYLHHGLECCLLSMGGKGEGSEGREGMGGGTDGRREVVTWCGRPLQEVFKVLTPTIEQQ